MVNKVFYMSYLYKEKVMVNKVFYMSYLTNRTYDTPYWPWLSLIQIGHIQDLIDHDCHLYKYDIYKAPICIKDNHGQ
jgi:hypothetical protein